MDVREKLVELILNADNDKNLGSYDLYELTHERTGCAEYFADYLIAHGVTVQEWISVSDRVPTREDANETESILAINKDEKYVGRWVWDIVARWPTEFTYWMPMPQPPKGE